MPLKQPKMCCGTKTWVNYLQTFAGEQIIKAFQNIRAALQDKTRAGLKFGEKENNPVNRQFAGLFYFDRRKLKQMVCPDSQGKWQQSLGVIRTGLHREQEKVFGEGALNIRAEPKPQRSQTKKSVCQQETQTHTEAHTLYMKHSWCFNKAWHLEAPEAHSSLPGKCLKHGAGPGSLPVPAALNPCRSWKPCNSSSQVLQMPWSSLLANSKSPHVPPHYKEEGQPRTPKIPGKGV